ncbi:MBL fold metallo-hydrolase [archaeon]|nr:MBL fold metallo-hydrolase [archaeon]
MFKKIAERIWKFTGKSDQANCYYLDFERKMMIDSCNRADRQFLVRDLKYMIEPSEIKMLVFTHLHHDHIGNFDLFENAELFASAEEIEDFEKDKMSAVLNEEMVERFTKKIKPLPETLNELEVVHVPGHTRGSIALWHEHTKTLFTGDTIFSMGAYGRTDLPTSSADSMKDSLKKLDKYRYKVMAPGHDY